VHGSSAVSPEAEAVSKAASAFVNSIELSQSLFGEKAAAISRLRALANECAKPDWDGNGAEAINSVALYNAELFLKALPERFPLPEFAIEPDGSVSLDWIESRNCVFSLSVGSNNRLAFAWLDGADKGHGVARFDGGQVPSRVLEGITSITSYASAPLRIA
jgi:hypothetical protein